MLKCVSPSEASYILREIHEGDCCDHSGSRSLIRKVTRARYFWLTLQKDAMTMVRKCEPCQKFSNIARQPHEQLHTIVPSWPFLKWGMDIVGKFPPAPGHLAFLLIATDYFTKWVKATSLSQVQEPQVIVFLGRISCVDLVCLMKLYGIMGHNLLEGNLESFVINDI